MIESLYTNRCSILSKVDDPDGFNLRQGIKTKEDISCLFVDKAGFIFGDDTSERLAISGTLYISEEVTETDQFVLDDGYIYDIVTNGIQYRKDPVTGLISNYEIKVIRRKEYDEESPEITESA